MILVILVQGYGCAILFALDEHLGPYFGTGGCFRPCSSRRANNPVRNARFESRGIMPIGGLELQHFFLSCSASVPRWGCVVPDQQLELQKPGWRLQVSSGLRVELHVSTCPLSSSIILYHPLSKECDIFCSLSETGRSCISGMVKLGRLILVDTCGQETMGWQLAQVEWFSSQLRRRTWCPSSKMLKRRPSVAWRTSRWPMVLQLMIIIDIYSLCFFIWHMTYVYIIIFKLTGCCCFFLGRWSTSTLCLSTRWPPGTRSTFCSWSALSQSGFSTKRIRMMCTNSQTQSCTSTPMMLWWIDKWIDKC